MVLSLQSGGEPCSEIDCVQAEAQERKRREGMIPPNEYYKTLQGDLWGSYDEDGIPLTKIDGQEVSKSQRQKLIKVTLTCSLPAGSGIRCWGTVGEATRSFHLGFVLAVHPARDCAVAIVTFNLGCMCSFLKNTNRCTKA